MIKALALAVMVLGTAPVTAGDIKTGAFWAPTTVSCGRLVELIRNKNDYIIDWYLGGFFTAYNWQAADTFNILGGADLKSAKLWLENYCTKQPLKDVFDGLNDLVKELHPRRQVTSP